MRAIRQGRGLSTYAALVLAFMILVVLWGAVVRATGSGAGCGDNWPLCNGDFVPHHPRIATIIEFTHRSMSGICTALVAVLIGWTFFARPRGHRARTAVVWTGVLLLTEALLGALLVLGGYVNRNASDTRVLVQCIHFTNTMLLLAALTLSWWWLRGVGIVSSSSQRARVLAWLALALTVVTGATGSVAALADTLFPSPSVRAGFAQDFAAKAPLLIHMRWMHPAAAVLAVLAAIALCFHLRRPAARWIAGLVALQVALGLADLFALTPISLQVLHLLGADLFWIALVVACSEVLACSSVPEPAPAAALS
ncbi:MAG TPA: COX15/CtaA family protein [Acidobacteriaceae bacterium]|jgi:cytochrome c oxidase assembly protein subunit 15|nr:COX15/CtaA family protein [Acidobacteriaceae bacterium]